MPQNEWLADPGAAVDEHTVGTSVPFFFLEEVYGAGARKRRRYRLKVITKSKSPKAYGFAIKSTYLGWP